jgi:hypothetical protein
MNITDAERFIRSLADRGYHAALEHVCGDTYAVRITDIELAIRTARQARFVLKYLKPRDDVTND